MTRAVTTPNFALVEATGDAAPTARHIRRVGSERLMLNGGAPDAMLCGARLGACRDLSTELTVEAVSAPVSPAGSQPALCPLCADSWGARVC